MSPRKLSEGLAIGELGTICAPTNQSCEVSIAATACKTVLVNSIPLTTQCKVIVFIEEYWAVAALGSSAMKCQRAVSGLGQSMHCPCRILTARPRRFSPAKRSGKNMQLHDLGNTAVPRMCPLRASKDGKQSQNKQSKAPQARLLANAGDGPPMT